MRSVGIKALKNRLSEYIRLVAAGETVLVTDHDRVVAEIVAPRADAVRQGWLVPPSLRDGLPPPRLPVGSAAEVLQGLFADRDAR